MFYNYRYTLTEILFSVTIIMDEEIFYCYSRPVSETAQKNYFVSVKDVLRTPYKGVVVISKLI